MKYQLQKQKIEKLIDISNSFYQELLGYKPEQTSLQQIPERKWNEFAEARGLNQNSSGIYLPRSQTAVIEQDNPLSLFHEYFGHGLYCEQTLQGRELVNLERRLLEEEKQKLKERKFTLEDVQRFRKQNKTFQELDKFKKENLCRPELFAIWTEYLLSGEHNLRENFERKYDSLSGQEKEAVDSVINFSAQYGNLAAFYAQGLARITTHKRVKDLLNDIYREKLKDIKFALLYGSRREFSDIDIFIVTDIDSPLRIKNNWLDVFTYPSKEFERKLTLFDIEITDPLFSGEIILGDKSYIKQQKRKLITQKITKEAIVYNLQESKKQERYASNFHEDHEYRRICLSYALTSKLIAENLTQGKRIFTKRDLLSNSKRASAEDEKPLQLEGGKEKNAT